MHPTQQSCHLSWKQHSSLEIRFSAIWKVDARDTLDKFPAFSLPDFLSSPSISMIPKSLSLPSYSSAPFSLPPAGMDWGTRAGTSKHMKCAKKELCMIDHQEKNNYFLSVISFIAQSTAESSEIDLVYKKRNKNGKHLRICIGYIRSVRTIWLLTGARRRFKPSSWTSWCLGAGTKLMCKLTSLQNNRRPEACS